MSRFDQDVENPKIYKLKTAPKIAVVEPVGVVDAKPAKPLLEPVSGGEVIQVKRCGEPWTPKVEEILTESTGFHDVIPGAKGEPRFVPNFGDLRQAFRNQFNPIYHEESGLLFKFTGKRYELLSEMALHNFADKNFNPTPKKSDCSEFQHWVERAEIRNSDFFNPVKKINFNNGYLDLETMEFRPHTPEIGFKSCLTYDFDENAVCPTFDQFLIDIFEGDEALSRMCLEYIGYALSGDDCWAAKALVLTGEGSNGKSTFLKAVKEVLGASNYSTSKVSYFTTKEYSVQRLDGKMANITEETPKDAMLDSSMFKDIVSGGDIEVRAIYGSPYDLTVRAKLIFACNDLPVATDQSHAFSRRLLIAPFKRQFTDSNADPHFGRKLTPELPGIFNKALLAYFDLKKRGRFEAVKASVEAVDAYKTQSNVVEQWVDAAIKVLPLPSEAIAPTDSMYFEFKEWTLQRGNKLINIDSFSKMLVRAVDHANERRTRQWLNGRKIRGFMGLKKLSGAPFLPV